MARLDYNPANDYYVLLGVDSDADSATVQRAYRQKAKEYHPDLNPGEDAKEKFQRLNEAYNVLNDAELRSQYDGLRWRFTTYSRRSSANPYDETSSREETLRRASQWQVQSFPTRHEHAAISPGCCFLPPCSSHCGCWTIAS